MSISETDLPGVGKKHEIELQDGQTLVIVTHNTGRRDLYLRREGESDGEKLFNLPDKLARTVGTILEGAHFQPVEDADRSTMLGESTLIEWFDVEDGSNLDGRTLADILSDEAIDVAVVAVERGEKVLSASNAENVVQAGDTVIAAGAREDLEEFATLLTV